MKKQPEVRMCSECNGMGTTRGIFHDFVCEQCDGAGLLEKHHGRKLTRAEAITTLRCLWRESTENVVRLETKLKALKHYQEKAAQDALVKSIYPDHIMNAKKSTRHTGGGD